jgi:hypothetical protein
MYKILPANAFEGNNGNQAVFDAAGFFSRKQRFRRRSEPLEDGRYSEHNKKQPADGLTTYCR